MLVKEIKRLFIACTTVFIFGCDAAETNSENSDALNDSTAYSAGGEQSYTEDSGGSESDNYDSGDDESGSDTGVTAVSSYNFTYNDSPGVSISFSTDTLEECTITFAKKSLVEKQKLETLKPEVGEVDLSCLSSGDLYMLDDTEKTYASMDIVKLNKSKATVVVSGSLYAVRSKKSAKMDDVELSVTDENLEYLLAK